MGCDLRATVQGHKRPDIAAVNAVCFIHTEAAIFAIDEDGVCAYVTSQSGEVPRNANRCRGAEYVACLDLCTEEGLVADPRVGGSALFVGRGASQKMALLRSGVITNVVFVDDVAAPTGDDVNEGDPAVGKDVSQVKPVDAIQRRLEEELALLERADAQREGCSSARPAAEVVESEPIELDPSELLSVEPTPLPAPMSSRRSPPPPGKEPTPSVFASPPPEARSNVTPLVAPTPPPRRPASPPAPALMNPTDLLQAALDVASPPNARGPSASEVDLGWGGVDLRKTRLGMPVVKLS